MHQFTGLHVRLQALEHGLNELFWEEWYFQDDLSRPYFFAPGLGELRLERPEQWRGGILSEEMGMGKTIEILALIQSSKLKRERERRERRGGGSSGGCEPGVIGADGVVGSHATLIVVPNHLVSQWASEISRCAPPSEVGKIQEFVGTNVTLYVSRDGPRPARSV
jgi:SNF2 family DNA or RNA helicase